MWRGTFVVLTVLVLVAGCGGSRSSGLSRAQYVARADDVCRGSYGVARTELARFGGASSLSWTSKTSARGVAILRTLETAMQVTADRLRAIPLPRGDESIPRTLVASVEQEASLLGQLASGYAAHDWTAQKRSLRQLVEVDARASRLAQQYGFQVCGRRPS